MPIRYSWLAILVVAASVSVTDGGILETMVRRCLVMVKQI